MSCRMPRLSLCSVGSPQKNPNLGVVWGHMRGPFLPGTLGVSIVNPANFARWISRWRQQSSGEGVKNSRVVSQR